jgi:hypothetical protein
MDALQQLALASGLAWASGIRLYAAIFIAGLLSHFGYLHLPENLQVLGHKYVLAASGILLVADFLADKIPAFDSVWDSIHTFLRIPAGIFLAWGTFGDATPAVQLAAGLLGGSITAGTHLAKAGTRALINTSPEPVSNWAASFTEDASFGVGMWLMIQHPLAFLIALGLFLMMLVWLLPKVWRALRALWRSLLGRPLTASSQ